jgi:RNA polymerase sigma-70 factor, ECF subfamily
MTHATEVVWERFSARLLAFIRRRVEDLPTAEDLLQEVFVRIHTRMNTLEDGSRLEAWVYQIARHAILDHYRRRRETVPVPDEIVDASEPVEPDPAEALAASLREMVEALPEPYREALLLTEFGGLSQAELAKRLGISFSGAKSRVQRARQKIKDDLLVCCHFELDRRGRVIDFWEHCCCCSPRP